MSSFGFVFDEWQEDVLRASLGERSDGRWASRQVGLSVPRQNGKTRLLVARALAGVLLFDERLIIVSAHRQDTAREAFFHITQLIDDNKTLESRVDFVGRSEMREYIRMKSGNEIRFKSRASGAGRGFSCDCLLLDEAQVLPEAAWASILPTMSARPNPQVWLVGTPPNDDDDSTVFGRIRAAGVEGAEPRLTYLEWSADPADDIEDAQTWASANPAYGTRIDYEAIAAELASMSPEQFRMERLGIWPDTDRHNPVVDEVTWNELVSAGPEDGSRPDALAVDMSHGRDISVSACWIDADTTIAHVEEVWSGAGAAQVVEFVATRASRRMPVVLDGASPASALIPELRNHRLNLTITTAADMAKACGMFVDRVEASTITHADQMSINAALQGARKRPIRDAGGWGWDRRDPTVSIYPLVAATLSVFGAVNASGKKTRRSQATFV